MYLETCELASLFQTFVFQLQSSLRAVFGPPNAPRRHRSLKHRGPQRSLRAPFLWRSDGLKSCQNVSGTPKFRALGPRGLSFWRPTQARPNLGMRAAEDSTGCKRAQQRLQLVGTSNLTGHCPWKYTLSLKNSTPTIRAAPAQIRIP